MPMVCNRCSTTHEQAMHCPTCGSALTYHQNRPKRLGGYAHLAKGWQHTDWGRFIIGVGMAQGLFYGLHHLLKSIVLAIGGEPLNAHPLTQLICIQGLLLFGLVAGSVTAGATRRQALILGAYIGTANSILSLLLGQWPAHAMNTYWVYSQPVIQIVVGSLCAVISGLIWKPLNIAVLPESPSRMAKKLGAKRPRFLKVLGGPIAWFQVTFGVLLAIAGCLAAPYLLSTALNAIDTLSLDEFMQESVVLWELKAVALLLGGGLAGAGSANGLKQGLVAGLVCCAVMNVILALRHANVEVVVLSMGLSFSLTLLGGWFGSQLFPPVVPRTRRLTEVGAATS